MVLVGRSFACVRRVSSHCEPGVSSLECLWTCANPELIDAGSVIAPLVSGTDSYGSLDEAKRSRAAVAS